jgi:hypothetical protein
LDDGGATGLLGDLARTDGERLAPHIRGYDSFHFFLLIVGGLISIT